MTRSHRSKESDRPMTNDQKAFREVTAAEAVGALARRLPRHRRPRAGRVGRRPHPGRHTAAPGRRAAANRRGAARQGRPAAPALRRRRTLGSRGRLADADGLHERREHEGAARPLEGAGRPMGGAGAAADARTDAALLAPRAHSRGRAGGAAKAARREGAADRGRRPRLADRPVPRRVRRRDDRLRG